MHIKWDPPLHNWVNVEKLRKKIHIELLMRLVGSEVLKCLKYSLALDADIRIDLYEGKNIFLYFFFFARTERYCYLQSYFFRIKRLRKCWEKVEEHDIISIQKRANNA